MTALYIILGILAFILILLMLPFRVKVEYEDEVHIRIGFAFLNFTVLPQKPKKPRKPKKSRKKKKPDENKKPETKPEKKKKNPILEYKDKHGLEGLLDLIREIVHIVVDLLKGLAKHLKISDLVINAVIAGEDSADTAMKYGYACSVIYPAVSLLENKAVLKKHKEDISAGFLAEKTVIEFRFTAKIRVLFILAAVIPSLFKFLKTIAKMK